MKNWALISVLGMAVIQATHCYGDASIKLSNLESKLPLDFANAKAVANGYDFYIQVLAAPIGGVLIPVAIVGTANTIFKIGKDGFFDAGVGVILGVQDNGYADFQVRVWRGMPTYELAAVLGLRTGISPWWQQKVGSWDPKTASPATATGPAMEMKLPLYYGYLEPVPPLATFGIFDSDPK
jgi:hypothetical protein